MTEENEQFDYSNGRRYFKMSEKVGDLVVAVQRKKSELDKAHKAKDEAQGRVNALSSELNELEKNLASAVQEESPEISKAFGRT